MITLSLFKNSSFTKKSLLCIVVLYFLGILFTSCFTTEALTPPTGSSLILSNSIYNLKAGNLSFTGGQPIVTGNYTKFRFDGEVIDTINNADNKQWDLAFRGTTILVNGGVTLNGKTDEPERTGQGGIYFVDDLFDNVTQADDSKFVKDSATRYALPTGSGKGWYIYTPVSQTDPSQGGIITAKAGRVFVIKTHDGKYAKVEIISYYKDSPSAPTVSSPQPYYTFRYVYQNQSGNNKFNK